MPEGNLHVFDSRTGKYYELPITRNAVRAQDINRIAAPPAGDSDPALKLAKGLRILDEGFQRTASHESKITWVDGEKGLLLFRGHSFDQLWDCDFEEVLHLLVWGSLPSPEMKEKIRSHIAEVAYSVPDSVANAIKTFPPESPAMPMMIAGLSAYMGAEPSILPAFNGGQTFHDNEEMVELGILTTVAVYSVVLGLALSHRRGAAFRKPSKTATFWENLLSMAGFVDAEGKPKKLLYDTLRHLGAMGADHEICNSTFALLVTASSLPDPISCLISAVCAAYGPLHMGACESAYKTMKKVDDPQLVVDFAKTGKQRLFGYGHRMYRTEDPRIARSKALIEILNAAAVAEGRQVDSALQTAMKIDQIASQDEYFIKRNLHANVDIYAVFVGLAMGFPVDFVPPIMICVRLPGLMAHWREAMNREKKLFRPAGMYAGPTAPTSTPKEEQQLVHEATKLQDSAPSTFVGKHNSVTVVQELFTAAAKAA